MIAGFRTDPEEIPVSICLPVLYDHLETKITLRLLQSKVTW